MFLNSKIKKKTQVEIIFGRTYNINEQFLIIFHTQIILHVALPDKQKSEQPSSSND